MPKVACNNGVLQLERSVLSIYKEVEKCDYSCITLSNLHSNTLKIKTYQVCELLPLNPRGYKPPNHHSTSEFGEHVDYFGRVHET